MRSKLIIALALVMVVGFSGVALAAIASSAHDLTDDYPAGTTNPCEYCHAPHNPNPGDAPLWNHALTAETFTMYGTTIQGNSPDAEPALASKRCLSCHDGVTNIDAYGGGAGTEDIGTAFPATVADLGTDLTDDHPISITNTGLPAAGQSQTTLPFYGSNVECSSCHDPHDTTNTPFLRQADDSICATCHTDK